MSQLEVVNTCFCARRFAISFTLLEWSRKKKKICFRNPMRRGKIFLSLENLNEHLMSMKHRVKFIAQDLLAVKSKKTPIMTKHIQMTERKAKMKRKSCQRQMMGRSNWFFFGLELESESKVVGRKLEVPK